jgi:hypothetical protein
VGAGPVPVTDRGLYPAEHRALRELHAMVRHLSGHWARLAERLGGAPAELLERGAAAARELQPELVERCAARGLHVYPAAEATGGRLAGLRGAGDLLLERNQALRAAVLDVQHVTTLLAYLAELAAAREDAALAAWHRRWEVRLRDVEASALAAAVALGRDPDGAIAPAEDSPLGRAGHSLAAGLGTLGESLDASPLGRAARRLRSRADAPSGH